MNEVIAKEVIAMEDDDDPRLVFRVFFQAEYDPMVRSLYLACGNREDAEDLVQEAMARAFERWDRIGEARSPAAYVYQIAFNLLRRRHRRRRIALWTPEDTVAKQDFAADLERREEIRTLLMRLPITQREALVLVEWVGMSVDGAAKVLRIRPSSVRVRLHRARALLQHDVGGKHE